MAHVCLELAGLFKIAADFIIYLLWEFGGVAEAPREEWGVFLSTSSTFSQVLGQKQLSLKQCKVEYMKEVGRI